MIKDFQCKDIDDVEVLGFLLFQKVHNNGAWSTYGSGNPTIQDVCPVGTPLKVQLAKMRILFRRGFIDGCTCGCRGDFVITEKGIDHLRKLTESVQL